MLAALYLPVGLLAARRDEQFWRKWDSAPKVFGLGLLLAFVLETLQLIVASRSPGVTDVIVGGTSVSLGWAIGRVLPATGRGLRPLASAFHERSIVGRGVDANGAMRDDLHQDRRPRLQRPKLFQFFKLLQPGLRHLRQS